MRRILWKRRAAPEGPSVLGFVEGGLYLLVREDRPTDAWRLEYRPVEGGTLALGWHRTLFEAQEAAARHAAGSGHAT